MSQAKFELEALWSAVFHERPVIEAEPDLLAALIVRCCGVAPPYTELLWPPRGSVPKPISPRSSGVE